MIIEDDFLYSLIFFFFIYKIEIMYISSSKTKKNYVYEYICVKLSFRDMNHGLYPPHLTNTYIYKVTIALNACNG